MAVVKNIGSDELRLIRVGRPLARPVSLGVNLVLAPGASGTVPDDFTISDGFVALVAANKVEILSFADDDILVAAETAQITSVFQVSMDNTPADFPSADNVAAIDTGGAETYDFSNPNDRSLAMTINGVAIAHSFVAADFSDIALATAAEVATSLTANAAFAAQATAADNGGSIEITSKALGTSSTVITAAGGGQTVLGLATSVVTGTGAPSLVQLLITKPDGTPAPGVTVTVHTFDAVTAGGTGPATTAVQVASKGSIVTGVFSNPADVKADANGEVDFEIVQAYGGVDSTFVEMIPPAGFFLAVSDRKGADSTREEIARS